MLVIEDEPSIMRLVRLYLEQAGFQVLMAQDGQTGLELHAREQPALVVLDVMLPVLDGWEVCRRIRERGATPILMLTARRTEDDRVTGLDLGADDYLTKPFSPRELISRVRAILRRTAPAAPAASSAEPERVTFDGLTIIPNAHRVEIEGRSVDLTAKEFDLLLAFARAPDRVFSREALLSQVWGFDYLGDSRTVDVHIGTLRKKIERDSAHPRYIKTVWRVGYKLDPSAASEDQAEESDPSSRE
ncbi:MAG TPA: response regulator transcription factor [Ktedonobacterales bacterium]|nr:response regulator transcription factor [Ktedonobacterales bacterium]